MPLELQDQVTRLFSALEYGEQLAHYCALKQAGWVNDGKSRRFLLAQARQETTHALFYRQAVQHLTPKHGYAIPYALKQFGQRLEGAMARNDLNDTLVGAQVVLEGFGEQLLLRLNRGMDERGVGFRRMRRLFLRQEQSHHAFGLKILSTRLIEEQVDQERINQLTGEYLYHIDAIVDEVADVFSVLGSDPDECIRDMLQAIPDWLVGKAP